MDGTAICGMVRVNINFKNHFIRHTILRVWNRCKVKICPKISLWLSPPEAFFRREILVIVTSFSYADLLIVTEREPRLKTREELKKEGYICQ